MIRPVAILLVGVLVGAAKSPPAPTAPPPKPPALASSRHAPIKVVVHRVRRSSRVPPKPPAESRPGALAGAAAWSLPLPPRPPVQVLAGELAPLPDADLEMPGSGAQKARFHVRIFSLDEHDSGLGFIPGSAYPAPEDRKPMQTPGITVSVPMR